MKLVGSADCIGKQWLSWYAGYRWREKRKKYSKEKCMSHDITPSLRVNVLIDQLPSQDGTRLDGTHGTLLQVLEYVSCRGSNPAPKCFLLHHNPTTSLGTQLCPWTCLLFWSLQWFQRHILHCLSCWVKGVDYEAWWVAVVNGLGSGVTGDFSGIWDVWGTRSEATSIRRTSCWPGIRLQRAHSAVELVCSRVVLS